jgi:hypothetical protein
MISVAGEGLLASVPGGESHALAPFVLTTLGASRASGFGSVRSSVPNKPNETSQAQANLSQTKPNRQFWQALQAKPGSSAWLEKLAKDCDI